MERDVAVMGGAGLGVLLFLAWWLRRLHETSADLGALAAVLLAGLIAATLLRSLLRTRRDSRVRRADEVAECMAELATVYEDVDQLLRVEGGRLRTETVARVTAALASANEALRSWSGAVTRPVRGDTDRLLADLSAAHRRMCHEVKIGSVGR